MREKTTAGVKEPNEFRNWMSTFFSRRAAFFSSWLRTYRRQMSNPIPRFSEAQLRAMPRDQLVQRIMELTNPGSGAVALSSSAVDKKSDSPVSKKEFCREPPAKKRKRGDREFDMSRYGQRTIALKLAYLGWNFHGFATQPNSAYSVEDHIFAALLKTRLIESREHCEYSRAGRTDVGVSALGQVVGLRVRSNVVKPSQGSDELDYVKIINSMLPVEIRVLSWAAVAGDGSSASLPVSSTTDERIGIMDPWGHEEMFIRRPGSPFSARFDALYRSYKYFFLKGNLDIAAMQSAASSFVGRHDFRNFCKIDAEKVTNFARVMYQVEIRRECDDSTVTDVESRVDGEYTRLYIFVRGQAFLWHQVRCMAAVLFEVGMCNEKPDIVRRMLVDADLGNGAFSGGKPTYQMAPATPLLLFDCAYPPSVVSFFASQPPQSSVMNSSFGRADAALASLFGESAAKTSILRTMLNTNDVFKLRTEGIDHEVVDHSPLFGTERQHRSLLPFVHGRFQFGRKHIPFEQRKREDSLEEKQRRIVEKKGSLIAEV
jgi:tRNA U38,U39,U40 pseudouridine synthase TruA